MPAYDAGAPTADVQQALAAEDGAALPGKIAFVPVQKPVDAKIAEEAQAALEPAAPAEAETTASAAEPVAVEAKPATLAAAPASGQILENEIISGPRPTCRSTRR